MLQSIRRRNRDHLSPFSYERICCVEQSLSVAIFFLPPGDRSGKKWKSTEKLRMRERENDGRARFLSVSLSVILAVVRNFYHATPAMYFMIKSRSILFSFDSVFPSLVCYIENFRNDREHLKFPVNFDCNMTHIYTLSQLLPASCRGDESLFFSFTLLILVKFSVLLFIHELLFPSGFSQGFSPLTRL